MIFPIECIVKPKYNLPIYLNLKSNLLTFIVIICLHLITLTTNKTIKLKLKLFIPKPELEVFKYRGPTCPIKSNIVE